MSRRRADVAAAAGVRCGASEVVAAAVCRRRRRDGVGAVHVAAVRQVRVAAGVGVVGARSATGNCRRRGAATSVPRRCLVPASVGAMCGIGTATVLSCAVAGRPSASAATAANVRARRCGVRRARCGHGTANESAVSVANSRLQSRGSSIAPASETRQTDGAMTRPARIPEDPQIRSPPRSLARRRRTKPNCNEILTVASRVPDHGKLTPWRFIVFRGDAGAKAGEALAKLYAEKNPGADPKKLEEERARLARAPLVVAVVSTAAPHEKIPEFEQLLSAGNAALNMVLAAHALGYAAQWTTGWIAYDADAGRAPRPEGRRALRRLRPHRHADRAAERPAAAGARRHRQRRGSRRPEPPAANLRLPRISW